MYSYWFYYISGSDDSLGMIEEVSEMISEAKSYGLATVVWSYARGGGYLKGETALDIVAYAAHIAALIGDNIIKVKPPSEAIETESVAEIYSNASNYKNLSNRIKHIMQATFSSKRLVIFSGGTAKTEDEIYKEIHAINDGGGNGSIIGRNSFQRYMRKL